MAVSAATPWLLLLLRTAAAAPVDCEACWKTSIAPMTEPECCAACPSQCPSKQCVQVHSTGYQCFDPKTEVRCDVGTGEIKCPMADVCPSVGQKCSQGSFPGLGSECQTCYLGQVPDADHCRCVQPPYTPTPGKCKPFGDRCEKAGECCGDGSVCIEQYGNLPTCVKKPDDRDCKYFGMRCSDTPKGTCGWDDPDVGTREACQHGSAVCGADNWGNYVCVLGPPSAQFQV